MKCESWECMQLGQKICGHDTSMILNMNPNIVNQDFSWFVAQPRLLLTECLNIDTAALTSHLIFNKSFPTGPHIKGEKKWVGCVKCWDLKGDVSGEVKNLWVSSSQKNKVTVIAFQVALTAMWRSYDVLLRRWDLDSENSHWKSRTRHVTHCILMCFESNLTELVKRKTAWNGKVIIWYTLYGTNMH